MNSQELFTIDEATGEIIPITQTSISNVSSQSLQEERSLNVNVQQGIGSSVTRQPPHLNVQSNQSQNFRQIQSQTPNQFRNNQQQARNIAQQADLSQKSFSYSVSQQPRGQFQSPNIISASPHQGFGVTNSQQKIQIAPPKPPVHSQIQQNIPYKNWKNNNMNNFRMVQPNSIIQNSNTTQFPNQQPTQFRQQPGFNQPSQRMDLSQINIVTPQQGFGTDIPQQQDLSMDTNQLYQFDENQMFDSQQTEFVQQSNRLRHGSFISKTNVQNTYNITSLPKQGSLSIRKARTGKNSEDIYL